MPRVAKVPGGKTGRRTKEEELREFVTATGGDMAKLDEFLGGALEPETVPAAADIRDRLLSTLSNQLGSLKGIALVQALKAITALAVIEDENKTDDELNDLRRPLLDRIDALPPEHAAGLVRQEIARVDGYRADLFAALTKLEAK